MNLNQALTEFKTRFPDDRAQSLQDVQGIELQGSVDEIKFARLTIIGGGSSMKDRPPKDWPAVALGCTTVVCGLGKLFGSEESALRALNVAARSGYVISATQEGNPAGVEQIWKPEEIRSIDRVLESAPEQYLHINTMKFFKRYADGVFKVDSPNTAAWADYNRNEIVFLALTFKNSDSIDTTIFHELSHHYDFQGIDQNPEVLISEKIGFSKISGWGSGILNSISEFREIRTDQTGSYTHAADASFVTNYASTSPLEDFAESCAYYRYRPTDLKIASLEKYNLLKDQVFKGVEYTESGGWPALDQEIVSMGGMSSLLSTCVSRIEQISMNGTNATIWMPEPGHPMSLVSSTSQDKMAGYCLKAVEDQVIARLQDNPEYCTRSADLAVRVTMERSIAGALADVSAAAEKSTQVNSDDDLVCLKTKDLTHNCSVVNNLQKNSTFLNLNLADRKLISDQFLKLMPIGKMQNDELLKNFPTQKIFEACLLAVSSISASTTGASYSWESSTMTFSSPDYAQDQDCLTAVAKIFTDAGYKINDAFISNELQSVPLKKTFDSFEKEVLETWSPPLASQLVTSWATKVGFDTRDPATLVPYLLVHVNSN